MIIRFTIGKTFWGLLTAIIILRGINAAILSGDSVYLISMVATAVAIALFFVLPLPTATITLHVVRDDDRTDETHDGQVTPPR